MGHQTPVRHVEPPVSSNFPRSCAQEPILILTSQMHLHWFAQGKLSFLELLSTYPSRAPHCEDRHRWSQETQAHPWLSWANCCILQEDLMPMWPGSLGWTGVRRIGMAPYTQHSRPAVQITWTPLAGPATLAYVYAYGCSPQFQCSCKWCTCCSDESELSGRLQSRHSPEPDTASGMNPESVRSTEACRRRKDLRRDRACHWALQVSAAHQGSTCRCRVPIYGFDWTEVRVRPRLCVASSTTMGRYETRSDMSCDQWLRNVVMLAAYSIAFTVLFNCLMRPVNNDTISHQLLKSR